MLCQRARNSIDCQWNCLRAAFNVVIRKSQECQKQIIEIHIDGPILIGAWIDKEITCWSEGDVVGKKCNVADDIMMFGSEQLWIPVTSGYDSKWT